MQLKKYFYSMLRLNNRSLILSNTFRTGLVGLSKSLSRELAPDNILINTIGPERIAKDSVAELDQIKANRLHLTFDEVRANFISGNAFKMSGSNSVLVPIFNPPYYSH
jgi:NAD(P)-dependent dehydrogenase (short-subunit alcohol dehydrogenase family)